MTNKTWDNLEVGDILIDEDGDERKIQEILGKMVFVSEPNNFEASDSYFMASEFEVMGWKIKGASENKPMDKEEILSELKTIAQFAESCAKFASGNDIKHFVNIAGMLKKLK